MNISWTTLIAFLAVVAAVTVLTALGHEVPAAITGSIGAFVTALLPALAKGSAPAKDPDTTVKP